MPRPLRDEILPPDENCFAHLYNRCVQGLYLCGKDRRTGKDYSYRKDWIVQRLEQLASVYLIDILAFAVLENHLHVVVRTLPEEVGKMTDREVAMRWLSLHPGRNIEDFICIEPDETQITDLLSDPDKILRIRKDISSCSYFMKDLCEPIAKRANKEEGRKGHFWEDRFKASRLLDALAILVCCAYVDLNAIRAGTAISLENSNHTSIQARILAKSLKRTTSVALIKLDLSDEDPGNGIEKISRDKLRERIQRAKDNSEKNMILMDAWLAKLTLEQDEFINPQEPQLNKLGIRASDKGFLHMDLQQYIVILHEALRFKPGNLELCRTQCDAIEETKTSRTPLENVLWMISDYKRVFRNSYRIGDAASLQKELSRSGKRWSRNSRIPSLFYGTSPLSFDQENKRFRRLKRNDEKNTKNIGVAAK